MSQIEKVKEATRVCLQEFAEGIMLGYRNRIFEAIDKRINEINEMPLAERRISGLEEAKAVIKELE